MTKITLNHSNGQVLKSKTDKFSSKIESLRMITLESLQNCIMRRSRFSLGLQWVDQALAGGLQAGYPFTVIAMKERELIDLVLHVMGQFWRYHPNGLVYIMDGNRHVRPELIENMVTHAGLDDQVAWEEQTAWFLPTSYLEATLMLDKITEIAASNHARGEEGASQPLMLVVHEVVTSLVMVEDDMRKVDAFFHQLSQAAFQHGLHVVTTNLIDLMDLLLDESVHLDEEDDDEWHWYQHYRHLDLQSPSEAASDEHVKQATSSRRNGMAAIPDPWNLALHQVAERELLARLPHHLYVLVDNVTGKRFGILKEQHVTIGKGEVMLPHSDGNPVA